ncbi:DUF1446 domain-containing protein [Amycolatopsis sp. NBC_00355]|uniref:acyclic terpene utilization AtuA family protein n=1 Tax=Amycolatopsis sp. NBC_00355 TaxID=2975957 RepID=UPI002E270565
MRDRAIRIGTFSGYLGDRFTALAEALEGDPVDVLAGDYLAEITLAMLAERHRRDPSRGYVEYFLDQLRPHLATLAERGVKVVTNAGGFHPAGLAGAVRAAAAEAGVTLSVAHVEGDNLLAVLDELAATHPLTHLDTGRPLSTWGTTPIAANAYLGGHGIAAALAGGADVVVCGRVTDASLAAGPAAWWHGWDAGDWDRLAGAVVAGHVIECGPQAVGGNFSGFTGVPGMAKPGFPIAEIAADGGSVITKHTRDGGTVTVDTVTAQLVYEIQGPRYLNPDVTAHLDDVRLTPAGPDRVAIAGVTGSPPPPTTKVAVFGQIGFSVVNTVYVTGLDIDAKIALLREQLGRADSVELDVTRIGVPAEDPGSQWDATAAVRIMATSRDREPLERFGLARRIGSLYLQSIPGFFHDGGGELAVRPRPRIDYWPAVLDAGVVPHRVVFADGPTRDVAPASQTSIVDQPAHPEPAEEPAGTRLVPLGTVAHARSGDKGGNCNLGVWTADPDAWPWLRRTLSTARLRELLPETADLEIVRHEFPHLRAVHFVLRGLLGTGGSANLRVDQVGKAVGEYLRARLVPVPEELLKGEDHR